MHPTSRTTIMLTICVAILVMAAAGVLVASLGSTGLESRDIPVVRIGSSAGGEPASTAANSTSPTSTDSTLDISPSASSFEEPTNEELAGAGEVDAAERETVSGTLRMQAGRGGAGQGSATSSTSGQNHGR